MPCPCPRAKRTGLIVPKQPPTPIEEVPPDMKPEGGNPTWIPGYWSWDDDRRDFIWVSGVWRSPPAQHRWMPGYWQPASATGQTGTEIPMGLGLLDALPLGRSYIPPPASTKRGERAHQQ